MMLFDISALALLLGCQEEHLVLKTLLQLFQWIL